MFRKQDKLFNCGAIALYNAIRAKGINYSFKNIRSLQKEINCNYMYGTDENDILTYVKKNIDPSSNIIKIKDQKQLNLLLKNNFLIFLYYTFNSRNEIRDGHYSLILNHKKSFYSIINHMSLKQVKNISTIEQLKNVKAQSKVSSSEIRDIISVKDRDCYPLVITIRKD